ncbi:unnamed protein product [Rhizophagus irregularis]|uniref:Uncharacterized protein n=1 Tax=Rhizophagus irregularis TaxID=588596 RepID=A0A2N1MKM5_9GLOM|nr:hypothetical protein RhiirC2_717884 [Rhizophagus irregularis]CAB4379657.1 unnamed protein product [Rhizophagus irregularis]CAB5336067.1 unnamed protein product [Rhizophagus irregularis]
MISRKLPFLVTVALFCMIFIGLTQTASLNKRQGDICFADFADGIDGLYTFTDFGGPFKLKKRSIMHRVNGQFTKGFEKDTDINNYEFFIMTKEGRKVDFTEDFKENVKIFPAGGTTPFQKVYKDDDHSVNNLIGGKFVVNHNGKKLASTILHF